jgi:hypothetical protein
MMKISASQTHANPMQTLLRIFKTYTDTYAEIAKYRYE